MNREPHSPVFLNSSDGFPSSTVWLTQLPQLSLSAVIGLPYETNPAVLGPSWVIALGESALLGEFVDKDFCKHAQPCRQGAGQDRDGNTMMSGPGEKSGER